MAEASKRKRRQDGSKRKRSRFSNVDSAAPDSGFEPQDDGRTHGAEAAPSKQPGSSARNSRWSTELAPKLSVDIALIPVAPVTTLRINRDKAKEKQRAKTAAANPPPPLLDTDPETNPYFDPNLEVNVEPRRAARATLQFVEEGKIASRAAKLRQRAEDEAITEQYRQRIAERARQNSSVPELPPYVEQRQPHASNTPIPEVEWWDEPFVDGGAYERKLPNGGMDIALKDGVLSTLMQHPKRITPSIPDKPPPVVPIMLTEKERKRVRRQRRQEAIQEKQQMIAVGLLPTPPPKVKLSNMMRVLANEATADPTRMEMRVRSEVDARRAQHEADNEKRRRTKEERAEQNAARQERDREAGLRACVYRVSCAANPAHRFKVVMNARQLGLTGTLVLFDDCNVVVVEGGSKACAKFRKLMLRRIDWTVLAPTGAELSTEAQEWAKRGKTNEAVLVWEGAITRAAFVEFGTIESKTESVARAFFKKKRVEHYWDLCVQASPPGDTTLGVRNVD